MKELTVEDNRLLDEFYAEILRAFNDPRGIPVYGWDDRAEDAVFIKLRPDLIVTVSRQEICVPCAREHCTRETR